jgi:hypothetical protein
MFAVARNASECDFHEVTRPSGSEIVKMFAVGRDASECDFHAVTRPSGSETVKMFAADHGKIAWAEAPTLLPHSWFECGGADSREMT